MGEGFGGTSAAGTEPNQQSYWLDACDDIPCDIIGDFVDFDSSIVGDTVDNSSNQEGLSNDFFGGIDHILDSIKNGGGLPSSNGSTLVGNGVQDVVGEGLIQNEGSGYSRNQVQGLTEVSNGSVGRDNVEKKGKVMNCDNGKGTNKCLSSGTENGVRKSSEVLSDCEEPSGKRARIGNFKNERQYANNTRRQDFARDREKKFCRKRPRDGDEFDRRDRDHNRRREQYNSSNRRDGRDRDSRGYWERDRSGSNDIVFRLGPWNAEHNKEGKEVNGVSQEGKEKLNKESEVKDHFIEEKARQYQLDVLEQAKKKNTIAFLETGAGKTLIAVLLMKSVCSDLQQHNKKMLAVFLVPKVPLVYQVCMFSKDLYLGCLYLGYHL